MMFDKKKVDNSIDCAYHKSNIFFIDDEQKLVCLLKEKSLSQSF